MAQKKPKKPGRPAPAKKRAAARKPAPAKRTAAPPAKRAPKAAVRKVARPAPAPKKTPAADPFGEKALVATFTELIRRAATTMPPDVLDALAAARDREDEGSVARETLGVLLENSRLANETSRPVCQDTGMPYFEVAAPRGVSIGAIERAASKAVGIATEKGFLRPNSVDTLSGKNTGNAPGRGMPIVHVHERGRAGLRAELILKGGGCENVGTQYSLPNTELGADRDLEGVKRVVLDAIFQAQGKGCAPGILGVCMGGDRANGLNEAKRQLFRKLGDRNPEPALAAAEEELLEKGNLLGVGPMGYGGKTTLLGVKMSHLARLPASYFVSVSYMCWATRRASVEVSPSGKAVYAQ
ncbi:MAG: fumarate hydratase [Thermoanaerobaculia bacterium]|nr:fumarate hydratase [Thermoanaerobaculia bacterium]